MKLKTEKGDVVIIQNGKEINFANISEAMAHVFYQKFLTLVKGKPIGVPMNDGRYPVRSLIPPLKKKVIYILDNDATEVR